MASIENREQLHKRLDRLTRKQEKIKKQIRYLSDREAMMDRAMAEYDRRSGHLSRFSTK